MAFLLMYFHTKMLPSNSLIEVKHPLADVKTKLHNLFK
ncbi:hypothetical protein ABIE66_004717 [Peribacillus sp. B2I2]